MEIALFRVRLSIATLPCTHFDGFDRCVGFYPISSSLRLPLCSQRGLLPRPCRPRERGSCSGFFSTSSRSSTVAVALLLLDDSSPGACVVVARRPRVAICHSRPRAGAPSE